MPAVGSLPEELLREILSYILVKPTEKFFLANYIRQGDVKSREIAPYSSVLLVCKQWHRIGTPILYTSLSLSRTKHAQSVLKVFRETPRLGSAVENLRLCGGFGPALASLVTQTPKVEALYVNSRVASIASIVGIRRALAILKPRTLFIHSPRDKIYSTKQTQIDALLESMIRERTSIVSLFISANEDVLDVDYLL